MGQIEFVTKGKQGEPLVYKRTFGDECILVALNPMDKETEIALDDETKKVIYSFGSNIIKGRKMVLSAQSATYILL